MSVLRSLFVLIFLPSLFLCLSVFLAKFTCDTSVNDKRTNKPLKPAALRFSREVILDRRCLLGERAEGEGLQVLLLS